MLNPTHELIVQVAQDQPNASPVYCQVDMDRGVFTFDGVQYGANHEYMLLSNFCTPGGICTLNWRTEFCLVDNDHREYCWRTFARLHDPRAGSLHHMVKINVSTWPDDTINVFGQCCAVYDTTIFHAA
jgi:hypothetical protein